MSGLEFIRKQLGYSGSAIAKKLSVSQPTVFEWEHGKRPIPQSRLKQLSTLFGIPEEYFGDVTNEQMEEITLIIELNRTREQQEFEDQECENARVSLKSSIKRIGNIAKSKPNKFESYEAYVSKIKSNTEICKAFADALEAYDSSIILKKILDKMVDVRKKSDSYLETIRELKKQFVEILDKAEENAIAAEFLKENQETELY